VLKAPFPWFGGKSRVSSLVWDRFGNVQNYVEPFFGSGAVLLGRPHAPSTETVNDLDCMVSNFWRALSHAPDEVALHADNPVNEADQHARHLWLCSQVEFRERMKTDPEFYDVKIAGWWVWGQCCWIGSGWCAQGGEPSKKRLSLGNAGRGINRQLPHLGNGGLGIHRTRPHLSGPGPGMGINREGPPILEYMRQLAERLRRVRVCCGDWSRVCGPSVTVGHGTTGIFLDPPYSDEANRDSNIYSYDSGDVAHAVREWAIELGSDPLARIALCGYEGEHEMPESWECVAWKAQGGFANQGNEQGRENAGRERIWFSPYCLRTTLFSNLLGDDGDQHLTHA
jgi:site-specific DNA-adenine methylase